MQNYKTAEEIAEQWNISSRHVQYLCRSGKIEGAIKRAGSWFIPDDMPIPVKNTKSGSKDFMFVGTKSKIFDNAIELFMTKGFNDVSLRDIAEKVGIRQSTIYNHFKSKQEILDTVYEFYSYYYQKDRISLKDMETVMRQESLLDIMDCISYDFKEEYAKKMADITKIIFQRVAIDDRAREIGKALFLDSGIKYVEEVFNMGVSCGRLAAFDTHAMSMFINSVRIFTLYSWIVDPSVENLIRMKEEERLLYRYAVRHLTDLKLP